MAIVAGGHGSPRYGCRQSWRHGTTTCPNRLTIRAKVADHLLLSELQNRLTAPETISYLTHVVSAEVARVLDARPQRRQQLESERLTTKRRLTNLAAAIEDDGPSTTVRQQLRDREAELARIEHELAAEPVALREKLTVLPSWVARQVGDVVDLLQDAPERTRTQFRRLGVSFMVSPVLDAERPFMRAVGSANVLDVLLAQEFDFPATGRSHPRSEQ